MFVVAPAFWCIILSFLGLSQRHKILLQKLCIILVMTSRISFLHQPILAACPNNNGIFFFHGTNAYCLTITLFSTIFLSNKVPNPPWPIQARQHSEHQNVEIVAYQSQNHKGKAIICYIHLSDWTDLLLQKGLLIRDHNFKSSGHTYTTKKKQDPYTTVLINHSHLPYAIELAL